MPDIVQIPITKGKANLSIPKEVIDGFSDEVYNMIVVEGLKALLNAKMSKVPSPAKKEGKELEETTKAAMEVAQANLDALVAGSFKKGRAAAASSSVDENGEKVPGPVMTEARRLAKETVKDEMKKHKIAISKTPASAITAAANQLIASDPSYIAKARENLAARANAKIAIDITSMVHESPELVAKAAKAKADKGLSATQAGKVAPRKKANAVNPAAI
jgi:hypothetical protein